MYTRSCGCVRRSNMDQTLFDDKKEELLHLVYLQTMQFRERFDGIEHRIPSESELLRIPTEDAQPLVPYNRGDLNQNQVGIRCDCNNQRESRSRSRNQETERVNSRDKSCCSIHTSNTDACDDTFDEEEFQELDEFLQEIGAQKYVLLGSCAFFVYMFLYMIYTIFISNSSGTLPDEKDDRKLCEDLIQNHMNKPFIRC